MEKLPKTSTKTCPHRMGNTTDMGGIISLFHKRLASSLAFLLSLARAAMAE
jgi:hypothetical protein